MLAGTGALDAQSVTQITSPNPRPNFPARPQADPLRVHQQYREAHVSVILQQLRQAAADRKTLTRADIDRKIAQMRGARKAGLLNGFFAMDLNGDNVLDKEELAAPQMDETNSVFRNIVSTADTDGDGTVSLIEASNHTATQVDARGTTQSIAAIYEQLLALDPNKDGKLTAAELETLALESFAKVDTDGDGVISKEESAAATPAAVMAARPNPAASMGARCAFPKIEGDQRLYVVTAYEGGTLSNTTVAGQDEGTETSTIEIAEGTDPVYLAVSSYTPMIWRITGHTERIARFFGAARKGVGVVGLPKEKVTLVGDRECLTRLENASPEMEQRQLSQLFNRLPEGISSIYTSGNLSLPSDFMQRNSKSAAAVMARRSVNFTLDGLPQKTIDKEIEPTVKSLRHFSPGGVADIDPAEVVSSGKAERYQVLPQEAGLVQLLQNGSLKAADPRPPGHPGYVALKEFPRFPAGLAGAHSVSFEFPSNMKLPEGSPGHSSVIVQPASESAKP
ncbi:hypothetical protein AAIH70_23560 [Neorhizobium sp. BT27B]